MSHFILRIYIERTLRDSWIECPIFFFGTWRNWIFGCVICLKEREHSHEKCPTTSGQWRHIRSNEPRDNTRSWKNFSFKKLRRVRAEGRKREELLIHCRHWGSLPVTPLDSSRYSFELLPFKCLFLFYLHPLFSLILTLLFVSSRVYNEHWRKNR